MSVPRSILSLTACCLLPSCFTAAVWGVEIDGDCGEPAPIEARGEEPDRGEGLLDHFAAKLVLTPFALALDCLTCPIQALFLGCEEDEGSRGPVRARRTDHREPAAIHAR
jgi:hypothetical protein